jgi:hypothetical protein
MHDRQWWITHAIDKSYQMYLDHEDRVEGVSCNLGVRENGTLFWPFTFGKEYSMTP